MIRKQLEEAGLIVIDQQGKQLRLAHDYTIEVEHAGLFKLLHAGAVVAPFDDVAELIGFIRMDMRLNGWG